MHAVFNVGSPDPHFIHTTPTFCLISKYQVKFIDPIVFVWDCAFLRHTVHLSVSYTLTEG